MHRFPLTIILLTSLCLAAPECSDPNLRRAKIGGNAIVGGVLLRKKPLASAKVVLYSSLGNTVWIGKTREDGSFKISKLLPGEYRLEIDGWGSTALEVSPELDKGHGGQIPLWSVLLIDGGCVARTMVIP